MYSSAGGDERAPADMDGAELAGGLVERQQREVEATNLVLGLHAVRAVLACKDWAVRAGHATRKTKHIGSIISIG
jgi:hypothetical protein